MLVSLCHSSRQQSPLSSWALCANCSPTHRHAASSPYTHTCTHMDAHTLVPPPTHKHASSSLYTHTHVLVPPPTHTHTHAGLLVPPPTHTHTHTHTHTSMLVPPVSWSHLRFTQSTFSPEPACCKGIGAAVPPVFTSATGWIPWGMFSS